MVRFQKETEDFLFKRIGKTGVEALKAYIEGNRKKGSGGLKLAILEDMFENNAFAEHAGMYFLSKRQMGKYDQEYRNRRAKFQKETEDFLFKRIGKTGVEALKAFIEGNRKKGSGGLKLAILEDMFENNAFAEHAGMYFLSKRQMGKYDQVLRERGGPRLGFKPTIVTLSKKAPKARPALPPEHIKTLATLIQSISIKGKRDPEEIWHSLPKNKKSLLTKYLITEYKKRFSFANACKRDVNPDVLLALAVGDPAHQKDFYVKFIMYSKRLEKAGNVDSKKIRNLVLNMAERKTWKDWAVNKKVKIQEAASLLELSQNTKKIGKTWLDNGLPMSFRKIEEVLIKLEKVAGRKLTVKDVSTFWAHVSKMPVWKNLRQGIVATVRDFFFVSLDFTKLTFPRAKEDPAYLKKWQTRFQNAVAKSFLENVAVIRQKKATFVPSDFFRAAWDALNKAIITIRMDMRAAVKVAQELPKPSARKVEGKRKLTIA